MGRVRKIACVFTHAIWTVLLNNVCFIYFFRACETRMRLFAAKKSQRILSECTLTSIIIICFFYVYLRALYSLFIYCFIYCSDYLLFIYLSIYCSDDCEKRIINNFINLKSMQYLACFDWTCFFFQIRTMKTKSWHVVIWFCFVVTPSWENELLVVQKYSLLIGFFQVQTILKWFSRIYRQIPIVCLRVTVIILLWCHGDKQRLK